MGTHELQYNEFILKISWRGVEYIEIILGARRLVTVDLICIWRSSVLHHDHQSFQELQWSFKRSKIITNTNFNGMHILLP